MKLIKIGLMSVLTLSSTFYIGCDGGSGSEIVAERAKFPGTDIPVTLKSGDKIILNDGTGTLTFKILPGEMLEIIDSAIMVGETLRYKRTRVGNTVVVSLLDVVFGVGFTTGGQDGVVSAVELLNGEASAVTAGINFKNSPSDETEDALYSEGLLLGLFLIADPDTGQIGIFESTNIILPDAGVGVSTTITVRELDITESGEFVLNGENSYDFNTPIFSGSFTRTLVP